MISDDSVVLVGQIKGNDVMCLLSEDKFMVEIDGKMITARARLAKKVKERYERVR
jgi:hypothetical protein